MKIPAAHRVGPWRVWLAAGGRAEAIAWVDLAARAEATSEPLHRSRHATTYRAGGRSGEVYLKFYCRTGLRTDLKDALRESKARHVLAVSAALAAAGFTVPEVLAAAEDRRGPFLRHAWVATAPFAGEPVAERLARLGRTVGPGGTAAATLAAKRSLLGALGAEAARLHARGFVAGDLVPANVWASAAPERAPIAFLDHDRTRAGRAPAPWWQARRNLVQLNRVVLPGVTATDRLRVYRAYANGRAWAWTDARHRLRWVVAKTVARRRRFDGVRLPADETVSFRLLMRADGPYAPAASTAARGAETETGH